jgi:hypothetical protein
MKITEQQLRNIITKTINEALEEFENPVNTLARGFSIDDDEPTTYEEVFARCGYEIEDEEPDNGGTIVYATRKTGAFGSFNGDDEDDVVYAMKRIGIRAKFLGNPRGKQYIFVFKIMQ